MIYERKLLTEEEVEIIQSIISTSSWVSGKLSGGTQADRKNNMEVHAAATPRFHKISKIIFDALDVDNKFLRITKPKETTSPLISRTSVGECYKPHQDSYKNGVFSTTVYLNDPSEYDGGYLRLYNDGIVREFKPQKGFAVTYDTGHPHEVSEVTRGHRDVAILWTKSELKMNKLGVIYSYLAELEDILRDGNQTIPESIEDAMKDPLFIVETLLEQTLREMN